MDLISYFDLDVLIYAALAVCLVKAVWRHTSRKLYTWLAAAFVILFPTWDVVLSTLIYYSACPFVPKAIIYNTADTDGIYYEGAYRDSIWLTFPLELAPNPQIKNTSIYEDFHKGYEYFEVLVTAIREHNKKRTVSPPQVYRCSQQGIYSQNPKYMLISCSPADKILSGYLVRTEINRFLQLRVNTQNIYDRSNGKLMAEYREMINEGYEGWTWAPVPFFNWLGLKWNMTSYGGASCPERSKFLDFQYEVLKAAKK